MQRCDHDQALDLLERAAREEAGGNVDCGAAIDFAEAMVRITGDVGDEADAILAQWVERSPHTFPGQEFRIKVLSTEWRTKTVDLLEHVRMSARVALEIASEHGSSVWPNTVRVDEPTMAWLRTVIDPEPDRPTWRRFLG